MNILQNSAMKGLLLGLMLIVSVSALPAAVAHAQDNSGYSGGCDLCDSGSTYVPDYNSTYTPSYDSSYTPSYDSSYTPSYDSSYTPSYDSSYTPSYDSSSVPSYSYSAPTYSSGTGYSSSPTYSVTNPSYDSGIYTTPGFGYSSGVYTTPGIGYGGYGGYGGYSSAPIYTPKPVNHASTPAPVAYTTPAPAQQQQQQQQQTTTAPAGQPITINNINTNTNTNPNTNTIVNTAPVAPAAPQTIVDYVYPQTITPVSCSIAANPNTIGNGAPTILSWTSYGATTAVLSDGIGSVPTNGTIAARPNASTDYILTVYGSAGTTATCNVMVNVGGYPSVSLSQIPYTGFDFGPIGDSIYWAALLAFALASAYLLVYYRGGAFTLATAMVTGRSSIKPVNFIEAETPATAPVEAPAIEKEAPVVAVNPRLASVIFPIQNLQTAEVRRMTSDAMIVSHSKNGGAPRIVITRG